MLLIRPAGPADLAEVLAMMRQFHLEEGLNVSASGAEASLTLLLGEPRHGCVLLAQRELEPCGYAVATHGFSLEFGGLFVLLDELFVAPSARGLGAGSQLLEAVVGHAHAVGAGTVRLEVEHRNREAQALYRARGFAAHPRELMTRWLQARGE